MKTLSSLKQRSPHKDEFLIFLQTNHKRLSWCSYPKDHFNDCYKYYSFFVFFFLYPLLFPSSQHSFFKYKKMINDLCVCRTYGARKVVNRSAILSSCIITHLFFKTVVGIFKCWIVVSFKMIFHSRKSKCLVFCCLFVTLVYSQLFISKFLFFFFVPTFVGELFRLRAVYLLCKNVNCVQ